MEGKVYKFPTGEQITSVEPPSIRQICDAISKLEHELLNQGFVEAAASLHKSINQVSFVIFNKQLEERKANTQA